MTMQEKIKEIESWKEPYYEIEEEDDGFYFVCYPSAGVMEEWKFDKNGKPICGDAFIANCPFGILHEKIY